MGRWTTAARLNLDFRPTHTTGKILPTRIPFLTEVVSTQEWQLRVDLAAAYLLVAAYGMSDLVFTHVSARIRCPEHQF